MFFWFMACIAIIIKFFIQLQTFYLPLYTQMLHKYRASLPLQDSKILFQSVLAEVALREFEKTIITLLSFCDSKDNVSDPTEEWLQQENWLRFIATNCCVIVGELYFAKMIDWVEIQHAFEYFLVKNVTWETVELSMKMLTKIGKFVEKPYVERLLIDIKVFISGQHVGIGQPTTRIRFMYRDLVELQQSGWKKMSVSSLDKNIAPEGKIALFDFY